MKTSKSNSTQNLVVTITVSGTTPDHGSRVSELVGVHPSIEVSFEAWCAWCVDDVANPLNGEDECVIEDEYSDEPWVESVLVGSIGDGKFQVSGSEMGFLSGDWFECSIDAAHVEFAGNPVSAIWNGEQVVVELGSDEQVYWPDLGPKTAVVSLDAGACCIPVELSPNEWCSVLMGQGFFARGTGDYEGIKVGVGCRFNDPRPGMVNGFVEWVDESDYISEAFEGSFDLEAEVSGGDSAESLTLDVFCNEAWTPRLQAHVATPSRKLASTHYPDVYVSTSLKIGTERETVGVSVPFGVWCAICMGGEYETNSSHEVVDQDVGSIDYTITFRFEKRRVEAKSECEGVVWDEVQVPTECLNVEWNSECLPFLALRVGSSHCQTVGLTAVDVISLLDGILRCESWTTPTFTYQGTKFHADLEFELFEDHNKTTITVDSEGRHGWSEQVISGGFSVDFRGFELKLDDDEWLPAVTARAEVGDAEAQSVLARAYSTGEGIEPNVWTARSWNRKAAEQGHPDAQYALGWYHQAAEQGHLDAQYALGLRYSGSPEMAVPWYQRAAEQGHVEAQHALGQAYSSGEGVERSPEVAASWYQRAAEQGHVDAQYVLGQAYSAGEGVEQSVMESEVCYRNAARQGHVEAQVELGKVATKPNDLKWVTDVAAQMELGQWFVATAPGQAVTWFRKAARQGHVAAQVELGKVVTGSVVVRNPVAQVELGRWVAVTAPAQAVGWFRKAARQGHVAAQVELAKMATGSKDLALVTDPAVQLHAGRCFVATDPAQAVSWFRKAARQGHVAAQVELAKMATVPKDLALVTDPVAQLHAGQRFVATDPAQAVSWFRQAARQGHVAAQVELAKMATGSQDLALVTDPAAQVHLGEYYASSDPAKAAIWVGKAVRQGQGVDSLKARAASGIPEAMFSLGKAYRDGLGVTVDQVAAYMWLELASAQVEDADIQHRAKTVCRFAAMDMAPEQIAAAQRLARGRLNTNSDAS